MLPANALAPLSPPPLLGLGLMHHAQAAANQPGADIDFLFRLALMEGHLMIGRELVRAGKQSLALPHFGHPVRELYDDIIAPLKAREVPGFGTALIRLEATMTRAPNAPATEAQFQAVLAAIARARASVPEQVRASVPNMIKICANVVDTAAGEYGSALERGRLRNAVEYHDSRGFVQWTAQEIERLKAGSPSVADQALIDNFRSVFSKVEAIVAPLMPPSPPRATLAQYRELATQSGVIAANQPLN